MNWKYTDASNSVVSRVLVDGSVESCLVEAIANWIEQGNTPDKADTPAKENLVSANIAAIQSALDSGAQAHGYDSILSACSYAAQPEGANFQAEGAAFLAWRSAVWASAYGVLAEVESGKRALPTPEEAVSMMPALVLPS